jgi:DNA-binding transcriptional regulator YdaS (Cro superfamily)
MMLSEFVSAWGSQSQLARQLQIAPQLVGQWAKGKRPVPISRCLPIEKATEGQVSRRDLRPDDWQTIWPELAAPHAREKKVEESSNADHLR